LPKSTTPHSTPLTLLENSASYEFDKHLTLVAERLEGGPVSSRVSVFPEVFGMAEGGSKGMEGGSKPWI